MNRPLLHSRNERGERTFAVRLIDRRTGLGHRVGGRLLVLFSRDPDQAVETLLEGRDPAIWETRVEPLGAEGGR